MMTFDEFIRAYNGKSTDYDGSCGVQCVDLAKLYLDKCFGIKPGAWGDARFYWLNFEKHPELVRAFDKIKNTPDFVPKKGDIAVWNEDISSTNNCGHIAICDGDGDTRYFYSYDQNWGGKACKRVKHSYVAFYGVLRPKTQSKATETVTPQAYPKCSANETSFVDALKSIKVDASFANRKKIAKANGISSYLGTASQNTALLGLLKAGKLIKD